MTTINKIEPAGLPIEVKVVNGDQLRVENLGDEELTICGYLRECEPYAKLGPDGVFVNHNSQAYYANLDTEQYGDVPDDAGQGAPDWQRVRRQPAFYAYQRMVSTSAKPLSLSNGIMSKPLRRLAGSDKFSRVYLPLRKPPASGLQAVKPSP